MNRLTEQEIAKYICDADKNTGVDAIDRETLEAINIDEVPKVTKKGDRIFDSEGKQIFKFDHFTPRAGTAYFKPSFAGRQVLLGREVRELYFSNGRWFSSSV